MPCIASIIIFNASQVTVSFDETTTLEDVDKLFKVFASGKPVSVEKFLEMMVFAIN